MSQQEANTPQVEEEQQHPDISVNLWWDDVRVGMSQIRISALLFALGALLLTADMWTILGGLLVFLGGAMTLHGINMSIEIPKESEARTTTGGTLGCLALCFVLCIVNYFYSDPKMSNILTLTSVVLGGLAHLMFVFTIMSIAKYLNAPRLFQSASRYLLIGTIFTAAFVAIYIFAPDTGFYSALVAIIGLLVGIFVALLANQTTRTIALLKEGEILARPDFVAETASAEVEETDVYSVIANHEPTKAFNDEQWQGLEVDDRSTAKVFVSLITSIFVLGVLLYTVVLCIVSF